MLFQRFPGGDEPTYEVCFKGIQKGSIVIISTLGVSKNKDVFIRGYNEMVKVIEPSLIMVVGKLYKEMDGEFLLFGLGETFSQTINSKQLKLFEINNYVKQYKGERIYG